MLLLSKACPFTHTKWWSGSAEHSNLCWRGCACLICLNSPKAEDRAEAVVVRLYEAHGSTVSAWLQTSLPVKEAML